MAAALKTVPLFGKAGRKSNVELGTVTRFDGSPFYRGEGVTQKGPVVLNVGLGYGILASPEEAEASVKSKVAGGALQSGQRARRGALGSYNPKTEFGAAEPAITRVRNDAMSAAQGLSDPANELNKIADEIATVQSAAQLGRLTPEQASRSLDALWEQYSRAQNAEMARGGRMWSQTNIAAAPEGSGSPSSVDNILVGGQYADDVPGVGLSGGAPEAPGQVFEPYRIDRPLTPEEAAEQGFWDGLDRDIRQPPPGYPRRNMHPPGFVNDLQRYGGLEPQDAGRIYSQAEIEAENAARGIPAGEKQAYSVAGVSGAAYALDANSEDPGVIAGPGVHEEGGRVTSGDEFRLRGNGLLDRMSDARARWALSQDARRADLEGDPLARVKAVPGFLGGIGREYAGMLAGGIGALGTAAVTSIGHELQSALAPITGGEVTIFPADVQELGEIVSQARDRWGGLADDNQLVQDIGAYIQERPWLMDALGLAGQVYNSGQDKADEMGEVAGVAYETILRGLSEFL